MERQASFENSSPLPPDTCITGGSNRNESSTGSGYRDWGGIDTLELSIFGGWSLRLWTGIRQLFADCRTAAEKESEEACFTLAGHACKMLPAGARKGVYCRYVFSWQGCRVYVRDEPSSCESVPGLSISIPSTVLLAKPAREVYDDFKAMVEECGFYWSHEVVSRCDVCVDLPEVNTSETIDRIAARACIKRGKKAEFYQVGESWSGYSIGKSTRLRIYDKLLECKQDPVKYPLMCERWGGEPSQAMRVEYQMRRSTLRKQFDVSDFADLEKKLPTIVNYLTSEWFRLTEEVPDRENNNTHHAKNSGLWDRVSEAFATVWNGAREFVQKRTRRPEAEPLRKQAVGCLVSAFALAAPATATLAEFRRWIKNQFLGGNEGIAAAYHLAIERRDENEIIRGPGAICPDGLAPF